MTLKELLRLGDVPFDDIIDNEKDLAREVQRARANEQGQRLGSWLHAPAEISQVGQKPLRGRWRTRSLLVALLVVWMGLLLDPTVGRMFWDAALGFGITLAVLALAMGLGLIGFGLFAVGDRVLAWLKAGSRWPDDGF